MKTFSGHVGALPTPVKHVISLGLTVGVEPAQVGKPTTLVFSFLIFHFKLAL